MTDWLYAAGSVCGIVSVVFNVVMLFRWRKFVKDQAARDLAQDGKFENASKRFESVSELAKLAHSRVTQALGSGVGRVRT